jgi:pimeloyl-ACP methyl ester carboxylesterase
MTIAFDPRVASLASGPVSYLKGGTGRPVLQIHSAGGPRITPVTERLAAKHSYFLPTVPGFNGTERHAAIKTMIDVADLMAEFVHGEIGGACDVVGESFGGWAATWLAARHPDLVDQLVLEAPAGLRREDVGGLPADPCERFRKLHAVPERAPRATLPEEVLAGNLRAARAYGGGVTLDAALEQALPRIKARTLILFGTLDEVTPARESGRRLKAGIKQSHLSYIYGAAHALEYDQPERVARLVGAFLERGEAFLVRTEAA